MSVTIKYAGGLLANLPTVSGSHSRYPEWIGSDFNESGSRQITSSLDPIDYVEYKPVFGFETEFTYNGWDEIPSTWAPISASLTGSLKTQICEAIPISESLFEEVYYLIAQESDVTTISGSNFYKVRDFRDGVLMEQYYVASSSADTGSGIPSWS